MTEGFLSVESTTVSEHIDKMIAYMKQSNTFESVSFNEAHGVLIFIFDNNRQDNKASFEDLEGWLKPRGGDNRRILDGQYDWWVNIFPTKELREAEQIMYLWGSLGKAWSGKK